MIKSETGKIVRQPGILSEIGPTHAQWVERGALWVLNWAKNEENEGFCFALFKYLTCTARRRRGRISDKIQGANGRSPECPNIFLQFLNMLGWHIVPVKQ